MRFPNEVLEAVQEEARNTGEPIDPIYNRPIIRQGLGLYYEAWFDLDYERNRSKLQPIPRSSVFQYAAHYEFSEEQSEDLWYYVSRMDREFLAVYSQQLKAMNGGGP